MSAWWRTFFGGWSPAANVTAAAPGGGNWARVVALQKQLWGRRLRENSLVSDKILKGPVTLFDFARDFDAADARHGATTRRGGVSRAVWKVSDDETLGGGSVSRLTFVEHERHLPRLPPHHGFVRWHGTIDTTVPSLSTTTPSGGGAKKVARSGFAYVRLPEFYPIAANLGNDYNALELTCRADGRIYTVNLKCDTFLDDDLYQGFMQLQQPPPPESTGNNHNHNSKDDDAAAAFVKMVLPFTEFVVTAGGRPREMQRKLDGNVTIEHIGFMMADGVDGDFQFDLAKIRAVNYYDGEIIDDDEEDHTGHDDDATATTNTDHANNSIKQV